MIRPFDWRDLPILHRYRNQSLCLNTALGLTRGDSLSPNVLLSYLSPSTEIFTWVSPDDEQPILGQLVRQFEAPFMRVSFLAPIRALKDIRTQEILEHMTKQAGKQGVHHLVAEIDELDPAYEILRKAGFGIYARQRIWKILADTSDEKPENPWKTVKERDVIPVQTLFHSVVPGLVAQIEPLDIQHLQGIVSYKNDNLIGYLDLKYGHRGIWAYPFIHPDVEEIDDHLNNMIASIPDRRSRPIYICVRTNQSWLEPALGEMDSQSSPLQAVMVKRLAVHHKVKHSLALPNLDGKTEVSPVAHSRRNS